MLRLLIILVVLIALGALGYLIQTGSTISFNPKSGNVQVWNPDSAAEAAKLAADNAALEAQRAAEIAALTAASAAHASDWTPQPDSTAAPLTSQDCADLYPNGITLGYGWSMEPFGHPGDLQSIDCAVPTQDVRVGQAVISYADYRRFDNGTAYGYPFGHQVVWRNETHYRVQGTCPECTSSGVYSFAHHYLGKVNYSAQTQEALCAFVKENRTQYASAVGWMCK